MSPTSRLASDKDCLFVRAIDEIGNRSSLCVKLLHFRPVLEVVYSNLAPHIAQDELALSDAVNVNGMGRFSVGMMRPESYWSFFETMKIVSVLIGGERASPRAL